MDLSQLKYFQKVARTENLTQAALQLNISQPTLSQSLRRLETELGCDLFVHTPGKRLMLNEAGRIFLGSVDRIFGELENGVRTVRQLSERTAGQIAVASSIAGLCCEITMSYYEHVRDVRIVQQLTEINSLGELLLSEEFDLALSPCPLDDEEPRLESVNLFTEEFFAIVGPGHPLYGRTSVAVEELLKERFILNYSESDRNYLYMLFGEDACQADVLLQSNEPAILRSMVSKGAGVSFMPARMVMRGMETGDPLVSAPIRITGYPHNTPFCITKKRRRKLHGAAAKFYDYVIDYCRREQVLLQYFMQRHFPDTTE